MKSGYLLSNLLTLLILFAFSAAAAGIEETTYVPYDHPAIQYVD